MHEAYEVSSLLKLTEQIETIACYDDNLLVGTRQGHLIIYLVVESTEMPKYKLQVLNYQKTFSKKPIQQIGVIPEQNLLVCLTDNLVFTHDLTVVNLPLVQTLQQTKGATLFALDNKKTTSFSGDIASVIRLCVAVKRKLNLYFCKHTELKELAEPIVIGDIPKVIEWGESVICVGYKYEYIFYNFTGEIKEKIVIGSDRVLEPVIVKMSDNKFMLGRNESLIIIEEILGKDLKLETSNTVIKWNSHPIVGIYDDPYVLGLLYDQVIVQTIEPNMYVQNLAELNKARILCKCHKGLIYAASVSQIWRIGVVDITKQRQSLLKEKNFEMALKLTNISDESEEEKKQKMISIQMLYALDLFDKKQYSESMKIFLDLNTNPHDVIKLFADFINPSKSEFQPGSQLPADVKQGLTAYIEYLTVMRRRVQTPPVTEDEEEKKKILKKNSDLLVTIDTTLLKCYLQTNDAFVASVIRLNNCKLEETEQVLLQYKKYSELKILYQTKGQHKKALQLLQDHAKQFDSGSQGYNQIINYLQHLDSSHINLIFQYSNSILAEHPEEGLKIFTEDTLEVEQLPRAKVLDFLLREHEQLAIPYLEHVIHTWNDTNSIFHNALVRMLREKIMDKKNTYTEGQQANLKAKLLKLLRESDYYSPESVLVHFPTDSLFKERAIVLGKLESHDQALSIYLYILGDIEEAIKYCNDFAEKCKDSKKISEVYIKLIQLLINPCYKSLENSPLSKVPYHPNTSQPNIDIALKLLDEHALKIDPVKILPVLPDSIPLSKLKNYLECAIHNQLSNRRNMQVLRGLLHAEKLQVQERKMIHEAQSVMIADYNVCPVCKKRFGNQSAFVRFPNGDIVHYKCQDHKY